VQTGGRPGHDFWWDLTATSMCASRLTNNTRL